MPDDDVLIALHYKEWRKSRERQDKYGDNLARQLEQELTMLNSLDENNLGFDYKLKLSRGLRKLRKRLEYGR